MDIIMTNMNNLNGATLSSFQVYLDNKIENAKEKGETFELKDASKYAGFTFSFKPATKVNNFSSKKISATYSNSYFKVENGKLKYSNPNLIETKNGFEWKKIEAKTNIPLGKNALAQQTKLAASKKTLFAAGSNPAKKFYAKTNESTKQLDAKPLGEFIKQLSDKSENLLKSNQVTVNGNKINDPDFILRTGDVVRVGVGHFINNSNLMAIVK